MLPTNTQNLQIGSKPDNTHYFQKPLSKITLFVISLLFAGGAIASHFTGLGLPGIVGFSFVSSGSMILFIFACLCKCNSTNKTQKSNLPVLPSKTNEEKTHISGMTDTELVQALVPLSTVSSSLEGSNPSPASSSENQLIFDTLGSKISAIFKTTASQGESAVANKLQPFFDIVQEDKDKLKTLTSVVVFNSNYTCIFIEKVLENLTWKNTQWKNDIITDSLTSYIVEQQIDWQENSINFENEQNSNGFRTHKLVVMTKNVFGRKDFTASTETISPLLAKAIGDAIRLSGEVALRLLQEQKDANGINQKTQIGIQVGIEQFVECRFSSSMVAPILPHLKNIPGLVGLSLGDVGLCSPWDKKSINNNGHGFKDEHASALLEILRTNPFLTQVEISVDGMSEAKKNEFMKEWVDIMNTHSFAPPQIDQILALLPPSEQTKEETSDSNIELEIAENDL